VSEIDGPGEASRRALEEARRQALAREAATAAKVRRPTSPPEDTIERSRGFGPFDARPTATPSPLHELPPALLAVPTSFEATPRLRGEWTPRVERLLWSESAPGLIGRAAATVKQKLQLVAADVVKAREALWSQPDRNARVRYGVELAGEHLDRLFEKWRAVQDTAAKRVAPAGRGFWEGLREARRELSRMREDVTSAGQELQEVAGWASSRGVRSALGEVRQIEQATRSAEGELRFARGRAAILYSAADPAFPAPELAAPPALAPDFTEADLARLGSGLDPARPPAQTLWNENQVNLWSRRRGASRAGSPRPRAARTPRSRDRR